MVRKRKLRTARVAGFTLTEGIHPAGSSLPWHTHDGPTICFVLQGAFTEISAGETLDCHPAMLKVTPAGERHWNRFDRGDAHGLLIEAEPARAEALRPYAAILDRHVSFQGGLPAAIARRIYEELRVMDEAAPLAIEGLLLELLAATTRQGNGAHAGSPQLGAAGPGSPACQSRAPPDACGARRRSRGPSGDACPHVSPLLRLQCRRIPPPASDRTRRAAARRV